MRRTFNRPSPRPGFTLVELLVVMTIIAILFALTAAAVVKVMAKGPEVQTRNEISQLQTDIQAFKTDFGVSYIPDRLVLPPGNDLASAQYVASVWPRMTGTNPSTPGPLSAGNVTFSLNGQSYTPFSYWKVSGNQPIVLQGYQTIVFFLGGAADATGNRVGFSTNPLDPMNTTIGGLGATTRKGPYFDFPTNRLAILPSDSAKGNMFPAFIDVYGSMPYLYFSAGKAGNDYNTTYNTTNLPSTSQNGTTTAGTAFSVLPFQVSSTRYANANGFQIIAAGKDTLFHDPPSVSNPNPYAGGLLWPGGGGGTDMGGYDNMANFHPTLLGVPAN